jgi:hypothetical protein
VRLAASIVLLLVLASRAAAQAPDPPGPWVIDIRGATSGLPSDTAFYPPISTETLVPSRAFGIDAGAHVYLFSLGPSRVGLGANYVRARGTTPGVAATFTTVAPQVSFNFGTVNGWSYLSAGYGRAAMVTRVESVGGPDTQESGSLASLNLGGGARWFLTRHVGIGFDVRWHRLGGTPGASVVSASAGFSVH